MTPIDPACVQNLANLARAAGSPAAGLLLAAAVNRQIAAGSGNAFTWTFLEIESETSLTRRYQLSARERLASAGFVEVRRDSGNAPLTWLVNLDRLGRAICTDADERNSHSVARIVHPPVQSARPQPAESRDQPAESRDGTYDPRDQPADPRDGTYDRCNETPKNGNSVARISHTKKSPNVSPTGILLELPSGSDAGASMREGTREAPTKTPPQKPPLPLPPGIPQPLFQELLTLGVPHHALRAAFKRHGADKVSAYFRRVKTLRRAGKCDNPLAMMLAFLRDGPELSEEKTPGWDAAAAADASLRVPPKPKTILERGQDIAAIRRDIQERNRAVLQGSTAAALPEVRS